MKVVLIGLCLFLTQAVFAGFVRVSDCDKNQNELIIYLKGENCDGDIDAGEPEIECVGKTVDFKFSEAKCSKKGESEITAEVKFPIANKKLLEELKKCDAKMIRLDTDHRGSLKFPLSIEEVEMALAN